MTIKRNRDFYEQVYDLVRKIPRGKVLPYGQIASMLGKPRAARSVGLALASCPNDVPWYRVVNYQGLVSIENINYPKELQARLLKSEGVKVNKVDNNWQVDFKKYLWSTKI